MWSGEASLRVSESPQRGGGGGAGRSGAWGRGSGQREPQA